MSPIIDSEQFVGEFDPETKKIRFHWRTEQAVDFCIALLQALYPTQAKLLENDGSSVFEEEWPPLDNSKRVTQGNCLEWILAHPRTWFRNADVVAGILEVPLAAAEDRLDSSKGRKNYRVTVNEAIRDALEALPEQWQVHTYQPGPSEDKRRCICKVGEEPPAKPGSLEGAGQR